MIAGHPTLAATLATLIPVALARAVLADLTLAPIAATPFARSERPNILLLLPIKVSIALLARLAI